MLKNARTFSLKKKDIQKKWVLIDASQVILGRLASYISLILQGKHKATFTPHMDGGDCVVVINAEKILLTGKKRTDREYHKHTGYPGGIKTTTPERILESKHPERLLTMAVKRMMTRNPMGDRRLGNLYVYAGEAHPHQAQQPEVLDFAARNRKNSIQKA